MELERIDNIPTETIGGFRVRPGKPLPFGVSKVGCFAIVLEKIPAALAAKVAQMISIPVIGIGAGNATDGQILVWQDFAGLSSGTRKFVKQYANIRAELDQAARTYRSEVLSGEFPGNEHSFES